MDLTAYRIVQEALTNVTKHAGTDSAQVRLTWDRDRVTITITDDGEGARRAPDHPPGYGLIGMRERAIAAGGDLSTGRRSEGGFRVRAQLPLQSGKGVAKGADGPTSVGRHTAGGATSDGEAGDAP